MVSFGVQSFSGEGVACPSGSLPTPAKTPACLAMGLSPNLNIRLRSTSIDVPVLLGPKVFQPFQNETLCRADGTLFVEHFLPAAAHQLFSSPHNPQPLN